MAPGRTGSHVASPAPVPSLPQVSFRKVEGEDVNEPAGVTDPTSRSYGYNDFSFFTRPDHYIRYIEPIESELTNQVEYDMDEQDQEWLDLVNEERKKAQVGPVSSEIFEIMMDRLEKEWFELMKRVPKPDIGLPSEDSTCAICDDGEGENSNAIVFCDGCNLAVHQDCYGVPYIPEGQWLCRKCTVSPEVPVPCVFCPNEGGAFKQTSTGQWAHLLCAMFIPEVTVGNTMFMEPIDNVEKVPKSRWKLTCSLCKIKHGACIQCDKTTCFAAFHVTCARRAKLLMGMKGLTGEEASFKGYCEKHLPDDVKETRGEISDIFEGPLTVPPSTPKSSKTARAYSKKYTLGPPLVPQLIADKLEAHYKKHFRQKPQFIQLVCKYWSLKREARRGAPLLKRLHLEPWTASVVTKQQTDEEKALKLQYLLHLRRDLDKVRMLTELTRKREQQKLLQAQLLQDIVSKVLFPHTPALKSALEQIQLLDKNELFHKPVTRAEAPDYFDIVKNPMSFMGIDAKLDKGEYLDLDSFKSDINLVFDNAMLYNKRDTVFHKTAARLKASSAHTLASLSAHPTFTLPDDHDPQDSWSVNPVGDLEADPEILNILLSEETIMDDTDLIVGTEPITSLFRLEQAKRKPVPLPPTPPPPKPPRPSKRKKERPKRDRKAERARHIHTQAVKAEENPMLLDSSPGFRAPRATRSSRAALAALEAEFAAGSTQSPSVDGASFNAQNADVLANSENPKTNDSGFAMPDGRPTIPARPRSWRREHMVLPGQGAPNMVDSMDDQGSFRNFDRGWILPSGTRRHGRAVPELPSVRDLPSPKKRARTDRGKSRLSVVSTEPFDDTGPQEAYSDGDKELCDNTAMEAPTDAMNVDQTRLEASGQSRHGQNSLDLHPELFSSVRVTRSSTAAESSASKTAPPEQEFLVHGAKRKRSGSVYSDVGGHEVEVESNQTAENGQQLLPKKSHKKRGNQSSVQPTPKSKTYGPQHGIITLQDGEMLLGGTLVWAKMESYPWWAAVVWEEDTKGVPLNVLRSKDTIPRSEPGPLTLVQFYDKARSWQWLELSSLRLLGEDKELDSLLLSGRGKVQTFRTPRLRQGCRQAYRQAIAEMEGPDDESNEGITNPSAEPSASAEPQTDVGLPGPAQSPPPTATQHSPQAPSSQSHSSEPQQVRSGVQTSMKDEPTDHSLTESGVLPQGSVLIPPPADIRESQTALSSELSDLDSEV
ncbi:hypothetical protein K439DRAFT_1659937 [Ramaria rubella]|nr:hypothetical protein K439DRAFT_1659937 [Ramaria rubella]